MSFGQLINGAWVPHTTSIVLLYRPGERAQEVAAEAALVSARAKADDWLQRDITETKITAACVCAEACAVVYRGRLGGAYTALLTLLGHTREADVLHILRSAGPAYCDQLPAPKTQEEDAESALAQRKA